MYFQTTASHYQYWTGYMSPYGVTRPYWEYYYSFGWNSPFKSSLSANQEQTEQFCAYILMPFMLMHWPLPLPTPKLHARYCASISSCRYNNIGSHWYWLSLITKRRVSYHNTVLANWIDFINSFPPSAAYMRQWIWSTLVQIMACRLFGAKPLCKSMLGYCQLDPRQKNSMRN